MTGYHVTDTRNRAGILCEGLLARDTIRHNFAHLTYEDHFFLPHNRGIEAVYVHHSPKEGAPVDSLTPEQRELLLEALRFYRAFGRYGEGREEFQAAVQAVLDIVGRPT